MLSEVVLAFKFVEKLEEPSKEHSVINVEYVEYIEYVENC